MTTELPHPKIKRRPIHPEREQEALRAGLNPLLAKIVASRPFLEGEDPQRLLIPKLNTLDNPESLADISKAVSRLIKALNHQEIIGLETDHDCDGQTSHAVLYMALTEYFGHPQDRIKSYIGHRLKEGYGLSASVANRILSETPRPQLIITADNGSSDEAQIAQLKQAGIEVIVTDHHEIPASGIPESAYAVINPTREDCQFPDPLIAGCMVAWLFMAATRSELMKIRQTQIPSLGELLDFVAVGTIADCVSIARSRNNRAVVSYGMKLIEQGKRPCWRALLPFLSHRVTSEELAFKIAPLLNSDGRLSSALGSVSFLLSEEDEVAKRWVQHLQEQNESRKKVQDKITQAAMVQALNQFKEGKASLCLFLEEGHAGVHGISASRVKDIFGRPTIIFCPKMEEKELLTGSARSIEGVHLRQVLQKVHSENPHLIERFGGHQGAAGLTLRREHLFQFTAEFERQVQKSVTLDLLGPIVWTDGELAIDQVNIPFISKLTSNLEPFGREFEPPTFEMTGKIISCMAIGQTQTHLKLGLAVEDLWLEAIWFHCRQNKEAPLPIAVGDRVQIVFSPKVQMFRGEKQLSCQVIHLTILN